MCRTLAIARFSALCRWTLVVVGEERISRLAALLGILLEADAVVALIRSPVVNLGFDNARPGGADVATGNRL
jgi:hypothetical protein